MPTIPTVSDWGLMVMALLVLTAGTFALRAAAGGSSVATVEAGGMPNRAVCGRRLGGSLAGCSGRFKDGGTPDFQPRYIRRRGLMLLWKRDAPGTTPSNMADETPDSNDRGRRATFRGGHVLLDGPVDWPEGTRLHVCPVVGDVELSKVAGHIIVAGFGLAGRYVVDLVEQAKLPYVVIEKNRATVETQRALGRQIVAGNVADTETLNKARLDEAAILALTIPDEEAVLEATALARRLNPDIYIIARTNYSSKGMRASQLGADEVVKAEQAVAVQFYERLRRQLQRRSDGN